MPFFTEKEHFDGIVSVLKGVNTDARVVTIEEGRYAVEVMLEGDRRAVWAPVEYSVLWGYTVIDKNGNEVDNGKASVTSGEASPDVVAKLIVDHHGIEGSDDEEPEDEEESVEA